MDKEQLYEETLVLKMEVNFFKEQNVRLKTKLQQTEKELGRKEDYLDDLQTAGKDRYFGSSLQSSHLISSLKHTIKELKSEIKSRDEENARLKRDTKVSRINELEIELQAYIDECTRLRHHIEEVMVRLQERNSSFEDVNKIEDIMRSLTAQKTTLEGKLASTQSELKQAKDQISLLEAKSKTQQPGELHSLKAEIRKLQHQLEQHDDCPKRYRSLEAETQKHRTDLASTAARLKESEIRREAAEEQLKVAMKELEELRLKPKSPPSGPIIDDSKYEISMKEVKVEASYESERAIIEEIEKSARKSTQAFAIKCRTALLSATEHAKTALLAALQTDNPVPESVFSALLAVGVKTNVDEVAVHLQALAPTLIADLRESAHAGEMEIASSVADTFRVKDEDSGYSEDKYEKESEEDSERPENMQEIDSPVEVGTKADGTDKVEKAMKILSFRLQLHRIPKNKLASVLFGKRFSPETVVTFADLYSILSNPPFNISDVEECRLVTSYALDSSAPGPQSHGPKSSKMKDITAKLIRILDDWEVFTTEDESDFDQHISKLLSRNMQDFLSLCKKKDSEHKGDITVEELKEICDELGFDFDDREFHYMELLFFSLNFQLNQVPYKKFVQAYAADDSRYEGSASQSDVHSSGDFSIDDEERHRLVKDYLDRISNELIAKSLSLPQVFKSKEGFLYPDRLISGMRTLGIPDMRKEELVVFLEALQCEDLDEYGIEMKFFEELVQSCGANKRSKDKSLVELGSSDESRSFGEHSI